MLDSYTDTYSANHLLTVLTGCIRYFSAGVDSRPPPKLVGTITRMSLCHCSTLSGGCLFTRDPEAQTLAHFDLGVRYTELQVAKNYYGNREHFTTASMITPELLPIDRVMMRRQRGDLRQN